MTEWILDLCPEIAPWQAEIISEHVNELIEKEREACAKICDEREFANVYGVKECATIIRLRG